MNTSSGSDAALVSSSSLMSEEDPTASVCTTNNTEDEDDEDNIHNDDDDDFFAEVGFMFESRQPVRLEKFQWKVSSSMNNNNVINEAKNTDDNNANDDRGQRTITVALHVADDSPGAVQSGHYLWPGAQLLCQYLVDQYSNNKQVKERDNCITTTSSPPISIVELGAGCALVSLTALQLWQDTLQCVCVTDHDRSTLVRARDNLETTTQALLSDCIDDDHLNAAINGIVSIPVVFESLEWGDTHAVDVLLQSSIQEHIVRNNSSDYGTLLPEEEESCCGTLSISVVLGSDLIYCVEVVEPLLKTAARLMGTTGPDAGRFLLSQSFAYDTATEIEIDRVCNTLHLNRTVLIDEDNSTRRIQEFTPQQAK